MFQGRIKKGETEKSEARFLRDNIKTRGVRTIIRDIS
jgi:hypothetical protein